RGAAHARRFAGPLPETWLRGRRARVRAPTALDPPGGRRRQPPGSRSALRHLDYDDGSLATLHTSQRCANPLDLVLALEQGIRRDGNGPVHAAADRKEGPYLAQPQPSDATPPARP